MKYQPGGRRFEPDYLHQENKRNPRNPNRFKAQRSGFETKRRSKGANEVFGRAGNGEERTLRRRGPVAQLARAYD